MKIVYIFFVTLFFFTIAFANTDLFDAFLGKSSQSSTLVTDKGGYFSLEVPEKANCQNNVRSVYCAPKSQKDVYIIEAKV